MWQNIIVGIFVFIAAYVVLRQWFPIGKKNHPVAALAVMAVVAVTQQKVAILFQIQILTNNFS